MATTTRAYTAGAFALELDGTSAFVQSATGGSIFADVVDEPVGPDGFAKKHLGTVQYEDVVIQAPVPLPATLHDWVARTWRAEAARKNGAVVAANAQGEAQSRQSFQDALLTEVTLPACDGSSKDAAFVSLRVTPESLKTEKASGKVSAEIKTKQKLWLPSNFRLAIDGLDCSRVARIEALSVRRLAVGDPVGAARDYANSPGRLEFPNLRITLSETGAQSWRDWHDDFVVRGNCTDDREKSGTLEYLTADLKDVLMSVRFSHLGIFRLAPLRDGAVARVICDLYCERFELVEAAAPAVAVRTDAAVTASALPTRPIAVTRPTL